jgi:ribosomal protein S18 acetylase RimI-like enzyme
MAVYIRPYEKELDFELVLAGEVESFRLSYPRIAVTAEVLAALRADVHHLTKGGKQSAFIAVDAEPVGFIILSTGRLEKKPFGYIENLFVAAAARGTGVARTLLGFAEEHFAQQGIESIQLDVFARHAAAIKLYEAQGYAVSRYRMEKRLDPP